MLYRAVLPLPFCKHTEDHCGAGLIGRSHHSFQRKRILLLCVPSRARLIALPGAPTNRPKASPGRRTTGGHPKILKTQQYQGHGPGPRVKICCCPLRHGSHPLKSWSLRQTRDGSQVEAVRSSVPPRTRRSNTAMDRQTANNRAAVNLAGFLVPGLRMLRRCLQTRFSRPGPGASSTAASSCVYLDHRIVRWPRSAAEWYNHERG